MYLNRIRCNVKSVVRHHFMKSSNESYANIDEISSEMAERFREIIRKTIKNCMEIYNMPFSENGGDYLLFKTYDDETILIGCLDGDNLILDSEFMYKRFCVYWRKLKKLDQNAEQIPNYFQFYESLYSQGILCRGIFWKKALYHFSIERGERPKVYFVISQKSVGYKETMVEWH